MSRSFKFVASAIALAGASMVLGGSSHVHAAVSATVVPGTLTQGATAATLTGNDYAVETNNLGDWPLDTGGFAGFVFPISVSNANFNAIDGFGSTSNTIIAFGNGGGVTLKFATPVNALVGQKEFGLFTAQFVNGSNGSYFNGNQEAAVLVSADNLTWRTLDGTLVASPTTYIATSSKLNTPTMSYDYRRSDRAWDYGMNGTAQATLDPLDVGDYTLPMPDDNLFNGSGTGAQRAATQGDSSEPNYDAIYGNSGGGNWFDISGSGLSQIQYVRLNGVNVDSGVRLDAVFANAAAVPEPALSAIFVLVAASLPRVRRSKR